MTAVLRPNGRRPLGIASADGPEFGETSAVVVARWCNGEWTNTLIHAINAADRLPRRRSDDSFTGTDVMLRDADAGVSGVGFPVPC